MASDSPPPRSGPARDLFVPALAAVAALLALPSAGLLRLPFVPADPAAYGTLLTALSAALLLAVAPARRGSALRVPTWLLALAPFFLYAWLEGGPPSLPPIGWFAVAVLVAALAWTPRRGAVAACVIVVVGAGAVLAHAGVDLLPDGWNPVTAADPEPRAAADPSLHPDATRTGPRLGAPVRLAAHEQPALGEGPGPWWVRATSERFPGPRPVVLVLDGASKPPDVPASVLPAGGGLTAVHASQVAFTSAVELLAFDALFVREGAWAEDDPGARQKAQAVAGYVRKGGLLIGPAPDHGWPPQLARALRQAAHGRGSGAAAVLPLGLGRVARAALQSHVQEVLEQRLWVRSVDTVLTARSEPPRGLDGLARWRDRPAERRTQGILLLAYVLVLAAFTRLLRGGGAQLLGVLLASAAVGTGLAWTAPQTPGFRAHGVALDLGGPGGRRVEAVLLDAGPRGYHGRVRWSGGGVLSLRGGRLDADGRLRVAPGRSAWIVRERDGRGPLPGEAEDVAAAVVRPLLLGAPDPRRLRFGRVEQLPVRIEGAGPVGALTVAYRGPAD